MLCFTKYSPRTIRAKRRIGARLKIKKNVLLKNYTTFRIGGPAKYFFVAKTKEDIISAVNWAREKNLPFFILGGGSNLLVADRGFEGLVIKVDNKDYKIKKGIIYAEAGISMSTLVKITGKLGLTGLEWVAGLPGTLGGAIRGNAGAFGSETKDIVISVEALDEKGKIKKLKRKQCRFAYRSSIFKKKNWIILAAALKLKKGDKRKIQSKIRDHIKYRKAKHPLEYPNAGSIFQNCDIKKVPKKILKMAQEVGVVKTDPFPLIPAAYLIAQTKLIGKRVGGAEVSEKHPNFIVNKKEATAEDVLKLIKIIKQKVKKKFGVELKEEIQYLDF